MILLDTHAWIWWVSDPEKLPARARKAVAQAAGEGALYISTISVWEVALLASRDRLQFKMDVRDWISRSESLPFFHFVPVDNAIALRAVGLAEPFHKDPADRMIMATAMIMGIPIVTSDEKILKYPHVKAIWR